ncbi:hypothetical protein H6P81_006043 [Aristolochia fimbriata]|uniref:Uncharacterized protein n=1 Tax=Aristolochia fimbriata TaxID=158543 RepID=A0AAV7EXD8_ARIFI|nr:hypothetical protein H6P81_006043 [Aristolochia fimbriata]
MGNCVFRGLVEAEDVIKVVTCNGGIMELYPPISVECITNEFPGQGIFHSGDLLTSPRPQPLLHNEELLPGELYYLLPLGPPHILGGVEYCRPATNYNTKGGEFVGSSSTTAAPYRMSSFDGQGMWRRAEAATEVVMPRSNNNINNASGGVWKVKLVISPEQLTEILSQETRTEALIESVRTVAKCGNGFASAANSDQWSVTSSWKASENFA